MSVCRLDEMQNTVAGPIQVSGIGIFTGASVVVKILPAPPGTGIVFHRTDLPRSLEIPARLEFVDATPRSTRLVRGQASVLLVEHLLSALYAYGVDNARIEINGPEIPGGDGSSLLFIEKLDAVGLQSQEVPRFVLKIDKPLFWSGGFVHLVALPSDSFQISYTLHYPHSPFIRSQYCSFSITPETYRKEIASCRTFSLYEEILPFLEKGLLKGGGLDNAVVIQGDRVLNPEGVRFSDEMGRHKVLDLIGDLSLIGHRLCAHVIAICSGHASNVAFGKIVAGAYNLRESNV